MFLGLRRTARFPVFEESLKRLPDQVAAVFGHKNNLVWQAGGKDVNAIVVNGMGGSNLGAEIVKTVFSGSLKLPLMIEPGYDVPAWVNSKTLYIVSSYSGTTEEPLAAYVRAKRRGAKLCVITGNENSTLFRKAEKDNISRLCFPTDANPSGQPRVGLGLSIASFLLIFRQLGCLTLADKDITAVIKQLKKKNTSLAKAPSPDRALAKKLAGREVMLIGGPFLEGNLKTLRNQWCENAKNYASYLVLSDMNHFAMEGLKHPASTPKRLAALFFESDLYDPRLVRRLALTKEVIRRQHIPVFSHTVTGQTALAQSFDLLQFGSWLTYYLALENKVDPMKIPWVDWFKNHLSA